MSETHHTLEPASSGRAKCRGCGRPIARGEIRLGERLPNPFAEGGDMTLWFHPRCGAYKRPEVLLEAIDASDLVLDDEATLRAAAEQSLGHRRLPRADVAQRAPSGRARCRSCREPIAKGGFRIGLVFYEEGRFSPGGYVHAGCAGEYFETTDLIDRIAHFTEDLDADARRELEAALAGGQGQ